MKFSVFTVATPELTPEELAAAAREAGIDAIEWRYKDAPANAEELQPSFWGNNRCTLQPSGGDAMIQRFGQAAIAEGLKTLSVTPYLTVGDLEGTEQVLKAASRIGAPFIRLGVSGYDRSRPFGELFELTRSYLKDAEALCEKYGVKGLVETHHNTIAPSASAAYRLCEGLNPNFIGVLYDPGNMVYEGYENYRMGLELLGPYLAHVHVKNAAWVTDGHAPDGSVRWKADWSGVKDGVVPWKQVIEDLKAVGYEGYLGVEDFSGQYAESASMLRHFTEYMNTLLRAE